MESETAFPNPAKHSRVPQSPLLAAQILNRRQLAGHQSTGRPHLSDEVQVAVRSETFFLNDSCVDCLMLLASLGDAGRQTQRCRYSRQVLPVACRNCEIRRSDQKTEARNCGHFLSKRNSLADGDFCRTTDIIGAIGVLLTSVNKAIRITDVNFRLTGARLTEFR